MLQGMPEVPELISGLAKAGPNRIQTTVISDSRRRTHLFIGLLCIVNPTRPSKSASRQRDMKDDLVPIITILLADDNSVVLNHVRAMLEKNKTYHVVGAVPDGASALREYSRLRPDVIILDISMQDLSGIEVAQQLRDAGCSAKIIFLTVHEDSDFLNAAMGAGGSAYVVKSRLNTDLISAITAVLANKVFVSANLLYMRQ
jgi:CheY-like chemotaxis protein